MLPTLIEAYAASGLLVKTLRFKDIKDFGGGIVRPAAVETDSPLYKGRAPTRSAASSKAVTSTSGCAAMPRCSR